MQFVCKKVVKRKILNRKYKYYPGLLPPSRGRSFYSIFTKIEFGDFKVNEFKNYIFTGLFLKIVF